MYFQVLWVLERNFWDVTTVNNGAHLHSVPSLFENFIFDWLIDTFITLFSYMVNTTGKWRNFYINGKCLSLLNKKILQAALVIRGLIIANLLINKFPICELKIRGPELKNASTANNEGNLYLQQLMAKHSNEERNMVGFLLD